MSSNFKCEYCNKYFSSRNAHSQHVKRCITTYFLSTEESENISNTNEKSLDSEDFKYIKELQIIREEDTDCIQESDQEYTGDIFFGEENLPENLQNYESELEPGSLQESRSFQNYEPELESIRSFQNYESESIRSYREEPEVEDIREFPNEAYADLMKLVVENNLTNNVGNAIIKFFNKHSNLSRSPLPKNIVTGRKFMDKMNISHLSHYKHKILVHNNHEYFIHYRPIINCIQNLLSNLEISQYLVYNYEDLKVSFIIF
jgi:hypothetical protein